MLNASSGVPSFKRAAAVNIALVSWLLHRLNAKKKIKNTVPTRFPGMLHRAEAALARGLSSVWMAFPKNWQQASQALPLQGTMMTNSVQAPCFAMTLGSGVDTSGDTSVSFLMTHSMPNVLDSSTASSSFSWSISNDEYGGKSSLLKQV